MKRLLRRVRREEGQDIVEYALLVSLVSMAAMAVILLTGPAVANAFHFIVNGLATV